jgi:hypothetical protein
MPDDLSTPLMLGEMRGQLRELVHTVNNLAQKFEDVARAVDKTSHIPTAVAENRAATVALEVRVTALEASENQRKGAVKLTEWAIRVVPFAALGAGFAVAAKVVGL